MHNLSRQWKEYTTHPVCIQRFFVFVTELFAIRRGTKKEGWRARQPAIKELSRGAGLENVEPTALRKNHEEVPDWKPEKQQKQHFVFSSRF